MKRKSPYASPEITLFKFNSIDIITTSGGSSKPPETDWEDDNVMGDGWV